MGLDISIGVDNYENIFDENYHQNDDEEIIKAELTK
jgi:hypothetical protein